MIRFDAEQKLYVAFLYKMLWDSYGVPQVRYTDDQQYWLRFNNKYWHQSTPTFKSVTLSQNQQKRLDEVNSFNTGGRWKGELASYVEFGAVDPKTKCPHLQDKAKAPEALEGLCQMRRESLLRQLSSIRYHKEVGGLTLSDGTHIATDRTSQVMLTTAKQSLVDSIDWKVDGGWIDIDVSNIDIIAEAVVKHRQCCFSAERQVHDLIVGESTLETLDVFDVASAFENAYSVLSGQ